MSLLYVESRQGQPVDLTRVSNLCKMKTISLLSGLRYSEHATGRSSLGAGTRGH